MRKTVLFFVSFYRKRAFAMDLSPFGRGGSPDGLAVPVRVQLAELSQLAQSSSGLLAQPACAHVRTRYAESSGRGAALRTPVVSGHWLANKRGPAAFQRGREPFRISTVCVEHKSRLWATADHVRRERRRGQGLVRLAGEPRAARIRRGKSYVNQAQRSRLAQCVTSSIRHGAGTAANELGGNSRRERLGCPAHP